MSPETERTMGRRLREQRDREWEKNKSVHGKSIGAGAGSTGAGGQDINESRDGKNNGPAVERTTRLSRWAGRASRPESGAQEPADRGINESRDGKNNGPVGGK